MTASQIVYHMLVACKSKWLSFSASKLPYALIDILRQDETCDGKWKNMAHVLSFKAFICIFNIFVAINYVLWEIVLSLEISSLVKGKWKPSLIYWR